MVYSESVKRSGPKVMSKREAERLARRVREAQTRLQPKLRGMDPGDLGLILERIFRPVPSGRRFFIRKRDDGSYVF